MDNLYLRNNIETRTIPISPMALFNDYDDDDQNQAIRRHDFRDSWLFNVWPINQR